MNIREFSNTTTKLLVGMLLAAAASISLLWESLLEELPKIAEEAETFVGKFMEHQVEAGHQKYLDALPTPPPSEVDLPSTASTVLLLGDDHESGTAPPKSPLFGEQSNAGGNDAVEDQQHHSFFDDKNDIGDKAFLRPKKASDLLLVPKAGAEASSSSNGSNQNLLLDDATENPIATEKDYPQQLDNDNKTTTKESRNGV